LEKHWAGKLGYLYVFIAAFFWATSGTLSKFLFHTGITPFQLVQLRTTIAAFSLFLWLVISKRMLLRMAKRDVVYFLLLGGILAITQFTYLYAISKIQVAVAILLQYMAPAFIVIYSIVFSRKKIAFVTLLALAGALTGCYIMVGAYSMDILTMNRIGIISGLASAITFAAYTVRSEHDMDRYAPWTLVFYALLFAAVAWNIFHPPLSAFVQPHSLLDWVFILYIGIFGTILPFGFYNKGIKLVQSAHASITATMEPVLAGAIANFFLNESLETLQLVGIFIVIGSILLLQMRQDTSFADKYR
jgi:drug/metabolite transporter, DME family